MIAPFHIFPLKIAFPCKPAGEAASAKSLADRLLFAVTPHSSGTCVRTHARAYHHVRKCARNKMGAGGSGSRGCKWSGCSGGQRPKTPLGYLPLKPEPGLHGHAKGANTHVRTHALPCQGCRSFTAMRRIQYVRTHVQFRRPIQGCKSSRPFRGRARDARDQRPELRMTVIKCKVRA